MSRKVTVTKRTLIKKKLGCIASKNNRSYLIDLLPELRNWIITFLSIKDKISFACSCISYNVLSNNWGWDDAKFLTINCADVTLNRCEYLKSLLYKDKFCISYENREKRLAVNPIEMIDNMKIDYCKLDYQRMFGLFHFLFNSVGKLNVVFLVSHNNMVPLMNFMKAFGMVNPNNISKSMIFINDGRISLHPQQKGFETCRIVLTARILVDVDKIDILVIEQGVKIPYLLEVYHTIILN